MPVKKPQKDESRSPWGLEEVRDILDLLAERGISEFEMEKNGYRVRVRRGVSSATGQLPATVVVEDSAPEGGPQGAHTAAASTVLAAGEKSGDLHVIKSPIVGTFYAAPKPGAPPYVKVGDAVRKGQALCVIEAMKLMNEIEAEVDGKIAKIFVENGQPVEYGQPLFGL